MAAEDSAASHYLQILGSIWSIEAVHILEGIKAGTSGEVTTHGTKSQVWGGGQGYQLETMHA